jgi:hypothetical protein
MYKVLAAVLLRYLPTQLYLRSFVCLLNNACKVTSQDLQQQQQQQHRQYTNQQQQGQALLMTGLCTELTASHEAVFRPQ